MTSNDSKQMAINAIKKILEVLEVTRVVFVDDYNGNGETTLESFIVDAISIEEQILLEILPELGDTVPGDFETLSAKLKNVFEGLQGEEKTTKLQILRQHARKADSDDDIELSAQIQTLHEFIPKEKFCPLTPDEWKQQEKEFIKESIDHKILFLFDRDFSRKGGDPNSGIKIIASLLANTQNNHLICGLLTHTVSPENQPEEWARLSDEYSIPKDRFLIIPKKIMVDDPVVFAQLLKFTSFTNDFVELKTKVSSILRQAVSEAEKLVDAINVYDLDHIVFNISYKEGLWEPDMLFRLHSLFHQIESRRLAHLDGSLESIASKLRSVADVPSFSKALNPPSNAYIIQRKELYEFDNHLNEIHSPICLGDIFIIDEPGSSKRYLLLRQPCDLMVRRGGKREPGIKRIPVVEIVPKSKTESQYSENLPYFGENQEEQWYLKYKAVHFVNSQILDFCVFNQDGKSRFILKNNPVTSLQPTWKDRQRLLQKEFEKQLKSIAHFIPSGSDNRLVREFKERSFHKVTEIFFKDDLFKGSIEFTDENTTINYNCKRIGRVSHARALGLLMSFTNFLGRSGYEVDFGMVEHIQDNEGSCSI